MGGLNSLLTMPLMESQDKVLTLLDILITIGVFLAFYVLARITSRQVQNKILKQAQVSGSARRLIGSVTSFSVLLAGVYTSLSYIGINVSVLLVPLGTVGVGLGLGLRSLASNYIAGLVILLEQTFKDGDLINVNGVKGTVLEIGLRATLVRSEENTEVLIPNSLLISRNLEVIEPKETS